MFKGFFSAKCANNPVNFQIVPMERFFETIAPKKKIEVTFLFLPRTYIIYAFLVVEMIFLNIFIAISEI